MTLNDPRYTTVEILTFNVNRNAMALGEVMSCLRKKTDLICICIQESTECLKTCEQHVCSFLEDYECKARGEHGFTIFGKVQFFVLQRVSVDGKFTFLSETMPFSFDIQNPRLYRPLKGAIFVKCMSPQFCRPFVFIGAHFHANEGPKYVKQRERDLQQIVDRVRERYADCDWCLFGDLNLRRSGDLKDEFENYFKTRGIIEHPSADEDTFKVDPNRRTGFDGKRTRSRTDRVCHGSDRDIQVQEYGVVRKSAAGPAAGAGSDHKPVYEIFRIAHRGSPFLVSHPASLRGRLAARI
jgi:hypothetical protein